MRLGVVIPTYNEAEFIGPTIDSLGQQRDRDGHGYGEGRLEVVVVDTPGNDGTPDAAQQTAARHPCLKVTVVSETEPSMVSARIAGIEYLMSRPNGPPDVLISGDADTSFPHGWLSAIEDVLNRGYRVVSTGGCFEHDFWMRCPQLSRRYIEQIGTIFFNPATANALLKPDDRPLFTPTLFEHFGRPVSDCAMAVTTELYEELGGIQQEFYDVNRLRPILAVGWPLMFRAELAGHVVGYLRSPEYETSARRLLHEPEALFSGASYLNEIEHFRERSEDQYAWLEQFANRLDMEPLRRYVIKNYILQQCITRPERIMANRRFFADAAEDLVRDVAGWRAEHPSVGTRDVFEFADQLTDRFHDVIFKQVEHIARAEST